MAANLFNLSVFLTLLSTLTNQNQKHVGISPPSCNRIECPGYDLIHTGNGFEIRRYNSSMWMSTSPIEDISFVDGTRTGFLQLFKYISGKNKYNEKIEMTAPVLTQIAPSDGPFCESTFTVSFYVPQVNQANPPPAEGLHVQKWGTTFVAVRQFGGFVKDSDIGEEAAALHDSLVASKWSDVVEKGEATVLPASYIVAQYNSPFEFTNRVNEIWMTFTMEEGVVV
ncbi:hypothetical protein ACHQM5_027828 [Ranunculus cassubicifolius]